MRQVSIDYSNTQNLINNLRSILRNLDNEKREVNSALRELYDLENYYYNKGEIVQELEYRQRKIRRDIESTEELIDNISRFLKEVKETDGNLANKFKQDIKAYAKKNNIDLVSDFERFLNKLQTGLDIVGCLPVIGDIADAINGVISLARGEIGTALISFIAVVPFVGDAAKGLKYLDKASDLLKLGDKAVDIGKATTKTAISKSIKNIKKEAIGLINKGENAVKEFLEATMNIGKDDYVLFLKKKPDVRVNLVTDGINPNGQAIIVGGCLTGDTLVVTDSGYKQIREISVGELVLSKNEKAGIGEYKKVTEIHKNSTYKSCRIKTKNSIIEATTGHLFMIKDKWWTAAVNIKEKDFIETSSNKYEEIVEVEIKNRDYPIITYNITVEDNHTYYVGEESILTHNIGKKNPCFDEVVKKVSDSNEVNYVLFNKTHKGSAPVPKGKGPNGGRLQSHHGLQQQWAKENLAKYGYNPDLAPTVTIETGKGMPHTSISTSQNARRNYRVANGKGKWSSSLQDELKYIVEDFTNAGFSKDTINGVLEQQYKMLDKLKVSYERIEIK